MISNYSHWINSGWYKPCCDYANVCIPEIVYIIYSEWKYWTNSVIVHKEVVDIHFPVCIFILCIGFGEES